MTTVVTFPSLHSMVCSGSDFLCQRLSCPRCNCVSILFRQCCIQSRIEFSQYENVRGYRGFLIIIGSVERSKRGMNPSLLSCFVLKKLGIILTMMDPL